MEGYSVAGENEQKMSLEQKEKIREGRDKFIRLFQILSMIWIPLALILTAVGTAMIAVGAQGEMGWPIFNVGPLLIGVFMVAAGIIAFFIHKKAKEFRDADETPRVLYSLLYGFQGMQTACHAMSGWASAFSFMAAAYCATDHEKYMKYCIPYKDANVVLASIGGALCVTFSILCITASCLMYRYCKVYKWNGCSCKRGC